MPFHHFVNCCSGNHDGRRLLCNFTLLSPSPNHARLYFVNSSRSGENVPLLTKKSRRSTTTAAAVASSSLPPAQQLHHQQYVEQHQSSMTIPPSESSSSLVIDEDNTPAPMPMMKGPSVNGHGRLPGRFVTSASEPALLTIQHHSIQQ
jgi:hypothetical protein